MEIPMKFTALKTDRASLDGITAHQFVEGTEYDYDGEALAKLRLFGIAPAAKAEPFNPVNETKPADPVDETKDGETNLEALTVKQLTEMAKDLGIELAGREKKADLIEAITAKQAEAA
jgi:hypothetical protein